MLCRRRRLPRHGRCHRAGTRRDRAGRARHDASLRCPARDRLPVDLAFDERAEPSPCAAGARRDRSAGVLEASAERFTQDPAHGAGSARHARGGCRGDTGGAADLLPDPLYDRAPAARPRDDRCLPRLVPPRCHLVCDARAPDGLNGAHDRSWDDHRRYGRAAVRGRALPTRQTGLRDHPRSGAGRLGHAKRQLCGVPPKSASSTWRVSR